MLKLHFLAHNRWLNVVGSKFVLLIQLMMQPTGANYRKAFCADSNYRKLFNVDSTYW